MFPSYAIDAHVPEAVVRDVRHEISRLKAKGGTRFMISVPLDDLAGVMTTVASAIGCPFTPTLCGVTVQGWAESFVGVMANFENQPGLRLFDAEGREHEVK